MDEMMFMSMIGKISEEVRAMKQQISTLEHEVKELRLFIDGDQEGADNDTGDSKFTPNQIRDYVMEKIHEIYPNLILKKGGTKIGARLTISNGEKTLRVLLRTSKSFREYPSGWYTLNEELIGSYDLYIFVVHFEGHLYTAILSPEQMKQWVQHKVTDSSGNYHLYVNEVHGHWSDDREDRKNAIEINEYMENWSVIEKLL